MVDTETESSENNKLLKVTDLNASYDASLILKRVNLELEEGSVMALLGRNGVGKTTLLKSLMGLIPKVNGSIEFAGQAIENLRPDQRAIRGIGYVPQGRDIFPNLTVKENLEVSMSISGEAGSAQLDFVYELFPVIKEMLSRKGGVLSGGQQQQLAIGRALLTNPKLLILDEPTEGIQPSIIDQIEDSIHRLKNESSISIILVEQYLDFAKAASDNYYIMDRGTVVQSGSSENLSIEIIQKYLTV